MDRETYVTKGYSSTRIPAQHGKHGHAPQNPVKDHVVDTKTINKERVPAVGYTKQFGSPTKFELLSEYVYGPNMSRSPKYSPSSYYEVNKPKYGINHESSNNHIFASPIYDYSSEKTNYGPGLAGVGQVRTREFYGPNQSLQGASPRETHSEGMGYFEESVNHLPRLDPRQRGVLDNLATRERSLETKSHYIRPPIVTKPSNTSQLYQY